uniref:Insulinase family protein n=1 Tax=uncultured Armatimonadetes bacterium TaxID=157466 RepID=A0A6J4IF39_9BACT|nr:hypothetical protein AVDCRST_MAG63-1886 [uncultured Armatimonadetes bacterium]
MPALPPRALLLSSACLAVLIIQPGPARAQPAPDRGAPAAKPAPAAKAAPALTVLENGLRVVVVERRSAPLAALELRVRAGTAYETPENNGVAHFLEHVLFKGTTTRKRGEVDAEVESVGGELTAETGKDWARFATVVPASAWRKTLHVLADVVQNPALRPEDIDVERQVILDEMASADTDPTRAPYGAVASVAFPAEHPYRLSLYGPEANVRRLKRDDLLAFWRARYTPGNMTLIAVGDVRRDDIVGAARALFPVPTPPATAAPASAPAAVELPDPGPISGAAARAAPLYRDRSLTTVVLAFRAPSVREWADAVALDVLLNILATGGQGRFHEALVRKEGLALAVSADYLTQRAPGILTLTAIGPGASAPALEAALLREVRRLRQDGVTDDEVDQGRRALIGQILFDEETFSGQANSLGFYDAIDSFEFAARYRERVAAVTTQDVARVIGQYLTPDRYAVATMQPRSAAPPASETAPKVEASR